MALVLTRLSKALSLGEQRSLGAFLRTPARTCGNSPLTANVRRGNIPGAAGGVHRKVCVPHISAYKWSVEQRINKGRCRQDYEQQLINVPPSREKNAMLVMCKANTMYEANSKHRNYINKTSQPGMEGK